MVLETKFNLYDKVWGIGRGMQSDWVKCGFCDGAGTVEGANGKARSCPDCFGRKGRNENHCTCWSISNNGLPMVVGQVRIMKQAAEGSVSAGGEERYMLKETGIGSGTLHCSERLFISKEQAQAGCDKLNAELETDTCSETP